MFPGSGFREQGDNGLAKPFHLFNHRMELQEKSRDANIEKFDNAIGNILRCGFLFEARGKLVSDLKASCSLLMTCAGFCVRERATEFPAQCH